MNLVRDINKTDAGTDRSMDLIQRQMDTGTDRSIALTRDTDRCKDQQIYGFDKYRQRDAGTDRFMDLITDTDGWTDRQIITFDKRHRQTLEGTDGWMDCDLN